MKPNPVLAKESLALLIAVAVMSLKVFVMLSLLHRWKVRNEPDI